MSNSLCFKNRSPLNIVRSRKSTDVFKMVDVNLIFGWNWLIFVMKESRLMCLKWWM